MEWRKRSDVMRSIHLNSAVVPACSEAAPRGGGIIWSWFEVKLRLEYSDYSTRIRVKGESTADQTTEFLNMDRNVKTEEGLVKRPRNGNRRSLPRESWTNQVEFLLATIGSVVGLGNIWRFPYLCYRNGGGAFLIPYMLMLLLCGIASLYMEMAVGQYSRRGPYHMLCQFCPLFKGLGLVMTVACCIGNARYIIVVVWSMFYLFKSFQSPFPWQDRALLGYNESFHANASTSAGQVYFNQEMLRISQGISHPGGICWDLLGLLLLAWIAVYFCIFRGIKLAGKVVYFTALFPYCLLIGLLINNCLLPGAWEGISYFIVPRWSKLMNVEVWIEAAGQIFSSLGVGEGVISSFSSYKDFNSTLLRDVLVIVLVNSMTSILSGFVIFSGLGYLSHVYNTPVENIAVDGPGLVLMVYPEVLSTMPLASVWAVSFFFMLFCLGIDSVFANVEMLTTFVMDSCGPYLLQKLHRKEFVVLLVCFTQMIMGIPYITQSGMYLFQLIEGQILFFVSPFNILIELVVIFWIYGTKRLCANVKEMTGQKPGLFFQICWRFLSPCILMAIILSKIILYKTIRYGEYTYPSWALVFLGWMTTIFVLIWIPLGMVHSLTRTTGTLWQRLVKSIEPTVSAVTGSNELNLESQEQPTEDVYLHNSGGVPG